MAARKETRQLHLLFLPQIAAGHMLPMLDMARLFARRGVKVSFATVPDNAPLVNTTIDREVAAGHPFQLLLLPYSATDAKLREGYETLTSQEEQLLRLFEISDLLELPFGQLLRETAPDAIVSDMFFPWSAWMAHGLGIPRLVFHGHCFFAQCAMNTLRSLGLGLGTRLPADSDEVVVLPGLPHRIEMLRTQIEDSRGQMPELTEMIGKMMEADRATYGSVMNSFYELETEYAEHYRKVLGKKAWAVGPVFLCSRDPAEWSARGNSKAAADGDRCLAWLDSQKPCSVVYLCFGSMCNFSAAQLREIALGLESCDHPFVWVVRKSPKDVCGEEEWMPEGLQRKVAEGKGLIIPGWSPQLLILNHPAVGAYVVHCGWNSCLESVTAGVPMVTWPLFAEQFYNERLVVDVLKVGVAVGSKQYSLREEWTLVKAEEVRRAVDEIMGKGEEAEGRRRRARELRVLASTAVEEGGSSYEDMGRLIRELMDRRDSRGNG